MKKIFALFAIALIVVSCGGFDTEAKIDEVLDIHDEVMPKMGEVMNLKRQVLAKAQEESDSTVVNELRALAKELDDASEAMMVWMREWSKNSQPHVSEESDIAERKLFFEQEIDKVTKVKEDINNSIAAAEAVLK